jgi:hypothetical protein
MIAINETRMSSAEKELFYNGSRIEVEVSSQNKIYPTPYIKTVILSSIL